MVFDGALACCIFFILLEPPLPLPQASSPDFNMARPVESQTINFHKLFKKPKGFSRSSWLGKLVRFYKGTDTCTYSIMYTVEYFKVILVFTVHKRLLGKY
jgi:hypothetical protein